MEACGDCGHPYKAHVDADCRECEDEVFFEDRAELLRCQGYVPDGDPESDPAYWFAVNAEIDRRLRK